MADQKEQDPNYGSENLEQNDQNPVQNRPSHMNQGNQTFIPDKERNRISRQRDEEQKKSDDSLRKAS